jgi:glycosyltransferase involved in cell wall biosynthesis
VNPHLLLITTSYPEPNADGSEAAGSFVSDFAETLARRIRVTVLAPGTKDLIENHGDLTISRFAGPGIPLSLLKPSNPMHWRTIIKILRYGNRRAEQIASAGSISHILALWALPSGYWARQVSRHHGIPYSVWALGSDIWTLGKLPLVKTVLRSVLYESKTCFADGYKLKEDAEYIGGRSCQFLPSVRRLPIEKNKPPRDKPPYRFAYLGRWHPNKGIDILLDAMAMLTDEDWEGIEAFRICGGGPLEPLVTARHAALKAAGRPVQLGGYQNKTGAAELLAWADYLVIPSRIESIPVIFSDALQAGCPMIATPVGDIPRLMQEYSPGILVDEPSSRAVATGLRAALDNPPIQYLEGLKKAHASFDLDRVCTQFLDSLDAVPS